MKEGEIEGKDGNKFKVYWHGDSPIPESPKPTQQCSEHGITEKGAEGCCPVGPAGMKGVAGKKESPPAALKEMLDKYLYGAGVTTIPIDDSLEKDIVHTPVRGRIYKIRQINIVARFKESHLISPDEGLGEWVVYEMQFRDMTLFINKGDLLLATEAEVTTFVGK